MNLIGGLDKKKRKLKGSVRWFSLECFEICFKWSTLETGNAFCVQYKKSTSYLLLFFYFFDRSYLLILIGYSLYLFLEQFFI